MDKCSRSELRLLNNAPNKIAISDIHVAGRDGRVFDVAETILVTCDADMWN